MKKDLDETIEALEDLLEIVPDEAALRLYFDDMLHDAPMSPAEFIAFAKELLAAAKHVRRKYEP